MMTNQELKDEISWCARRVMELRNEAAYCKKMGFWSQRIEAVRKAMAYRSRLCQYRTEV